MFTRGITTANCAVFHTASQLSRVPCEARRKCRTSFVCHPLISTIAFGSYAYWFEVKICNEIDRFTVDRGRGRERRREMACCACMDMQRHFHTILTSSLTTASSI